MKKTFNILNAALLLIILSSCGMDHSIILNHNLNTTQVQLGAGNYKVLERIHGSAQVPYILIFGGMNKKQLYANAYSNMMDKANLTNGSKALTNIVTEEHIGGIFPFYYVRTVTVSAHVIEFTK